MTDEERPPEDQTDDVVDGFDVSEGESTPPPSVEQYGEEAVRDFDLDDSERLPDESFDLDAGSGDPTAEEDFSEEAYATELADMPAQTSTAKKKPESVKAKLIALVVIPLLTLTIVLLWRLPKSDDFKAYETGCVKAASEFLKGYSDNTDDSVARSNTVLVTVRLRDSVDDTEIEDDYAKATKGLGKFLNIGEPDWDSDSTSFSATARLSSGTLPVWLKFEQTEKLGKTVYLIDGYRFGYP